MPGQRYASSNAAGRCYFPSPKYAGSNEETLSPYRRLEQQHRDLAHESALQLYEYQNNVMFPSRAPTNPQITPHAHYRPQHEQQ